MQAQIKPRKVDFKFSQYISQGFELLKGNFISVFCAQYFAFADGISQIENGGELPTY